MSRIRFIAGALGTLVAVLAGVGVAIASVNYIEDRETGFDGLLRADWQRGMNVTAFLPDAYTTPTADRALLTARSVGTQRVALVPTWYMSQSSSNEVFSDPAKTPTDASIEGAAARAHELGFSVVLKPHVDVQDGTFRGDIMPADSGAWFASYGEMLMHNAELAQRIDADVLVVGTELTSMSLYPDEWRELIDRVRTVYSGELTFAANWVDGAENIEFWNKLDFIGIDAYMPLQTSDPSNPTLGELLDAWGPYRVRIDAVRQRWHKPVVFTQLRYESKVGTAAKLEGDQPPSQEQQALAYTAAYQTFKDIPWFKGIWWWDWSAEGINPPEGWSAQHKQAENTLYQWQGAGAQSP